MVLQKVLFLGINANPLSMGCLEALATTKLYRLTVGIDRRRTPFERLRNTLRTHSLTGLADRAVSRLTRKRVAQKALGGLGHSLIEFAEARNIPWFECCDVNGIEEQTRITSLEPDLIVVASFSQIIRAKTRNIPRLGVINVHPSLLPKYRGPIPTYWVLKNDESQTGVTVHRVTAKVDAGDILLQREFSIDSSDNEQTLQVRAAELGASILQEAVEGLLSGTLAGVPQDESQASYYGFP